MVPFLFSIKIVKLSMALCFSWVVESSTLIWLKKILSWESAPRSTTTTTPVDTSIQRETPLLSESLPSNPDRMQTQIALSKIEAAYIALSQSMRDLIPIIEVLK
jgi:hypothetical protein